MSSYRGAQSVKGGTIDDRRLAEVTVSIPARIAGVSLSVPPGVAAECDEGRQRVKPTRASAAESLLDKLAAEPVVTTKDVEDDLGLSVATTHRVIDRLRDAGIIRPLTNRTRNQVWGAGDILDELADLDVRIAARAREE